MASLEQELRIRSRQQAALAALGQSAIAARDRDRLLQEAVECARETLGLDYAALVQAIEADRFVVRAGTGWQRDVIGDEVPPLDAVPGAYILRSEEPVVMSDAAAGPHFPLSPFLETHGVQSGAGVAIRGRLRPWGVLAVFGARPHAFSTEDVGFLQSLSNIAALVIERDEMETERRDATSAFLESTARFAQMFRVSPVALAIATAADARIIDVNEAWLRMFGYDRNDVIGRTAADLSLLVDPPQHHTVLARTDRQGLIRDTEMVVRTKHGDLRHVLLSGVPVRISSEGDLWISAQMDITERKHMESELRALSRRLLGAHEEERRRIAVELHDDLGQLLTAAKIGLDAALRRVPDPDLSVVNEALDQAIHHVRDLAIDLRPSVLDDLGLSAALRWYADRLRGQAPLAVRPSIDDIRGLDPAVETACFRLAQEAVTNILKHASARTVWLDLHCFGAFLELRVRDDGRGFDVAAARRRAHGGRSLGLIGMEERVSLAGGEFEIISGEGQGSEVRAKFDAAVARRTA